MVYNVEGSTVAHEQRKVSHLDTGALKDLRDILLGWLRGTAELKEQVD